MEDSNNRWRPDEDETQDLGGIVHLEHLNLNVDSQGVATIFYIEGLGLTRDPYQTVGAGTMWANAGRQQIHLPLRPPAQKITGHVGLAMPSLSALLDRLKAVQERLTDTKFQFEVVQSGPRTIPYLERAATDQYVKVTCPWGNEFRVYESRLQSGERGTLSIPYLEELCAKGTALRIGDYYRTVFDAPVYCDDPDAELKTIWVRCGVRQYLVYRETEEKLSYSGYHVCIYITNFSRAYKWAKEHNTLFSSTRFADKCSTIEEALSWHQFRTIDIVADDKSVIHQLEHEIRSLYHPSFLRTLVNRFGDVGIFCQQ